jgi:hypothetical protein
MIGLICRAENNRVFLNYNVEMRPGYLGRWIEFISYEIWTSNEDILMLMRDRWGKVKYSKFLEEQLKRSSYKSKSLPSGKQNDMSHTSHDNLVSLP